MNILELGMWFLFVYAIGAFAIGLPMAKLELLVMREPDQHKVLRAFFYPFRIKPENYPDSRERRWKIVSKTMIFWPPVLLVIFVVFLFWQIVRIFITAIEFAVSLLQRFKDFASN